MRGDGTGRPRGLSIPLPMACGTQRGGPSPDRRAVSQIVQAASDYRMTLTFCVLLAPSLWIRAQ